MNFKQVLEIPALRRIWVAQLVSVLGDMLALFAVFAVATFRWHATPIQLSLVLVAYMLPLALCGPFAGVLVDHWNRKRAMILSDVIRGVLCLLLLLARDLNQIYAILFSLSVVSSVFIPAQSVLIRAIVPKEGLLTANALMAQAFQVVQLVSPAIAGALVGWIGADFCFGFDSLSFFFSATLLARMEAPVLPPAAAQQLRTLLSDLTAGVRFIFTHASLSFVMVSMTAGMFAIRCFGALFGVYVRDVLTLGPTAFGILNSLVGVGMIGGTQFIHHVGRGVDRRRLVSAGLLISGLFLALLAAGGLVATTAIGMIGLGLGGSFIFIPAQTLLQEVTPMEMMGRVTSSLISVLAFTQTIALTLSGHAANVVGIRNMFFLSAALVGVIALAGFHRMRRSLV